MAVDLAQFHELFFDESTESLDVLEAGLLALSPDDAGPDALHPLFRVAHSIKGAAGTFGFPAIVRLTHAAETVLARSRDDGSPLTGDAVKALLGAVDCIRDMIAGAQAGEAEDTLRVDAVCAALKTLSGRTDGRSQGPTRTAGRQRTRTPVRTTLRVPVGRLNRVAGRMGELTMAHARVQALLSERDTGTDGALSSALRELDLRVRQLDRDVTRLRLQAVSVVFDRLPRLVRELESQLEKRVSLALDGGETEMDRAVLERLADPLVHLVRNAVDHGIEQPAQRVRAGKPESGQIRVSARHRDGEVVIAVEDDGAGLDRRRVLARARGRGLVQADSVPGDSDLAALLFAPGFSTVERISEVSGRGVGLDVVRQSVEALGGRVEARTHPGQGCRFVLRLPRMLTAIGTFASIDGERPDEAETGGCADRVAGGGSIDELAVNGMAQVPGSAAEAARSVAHSCSARVPVRTTAPSGPRGGGDDLDPR